MRVLGVFFIFFCTSCAYQNEEADLIIHNAVIYSCDEQFSMHHAMAIKDGKVLEVGPERQIMNKYYADEVIDNRSRPIYPFFIGSRNFVGDFLKMTKTLDALDTERREVLLTLTRFKAMQEYIEDYGVLTAGKEADFFITEIDLLTANKATLRDIKVVSVYDDGILR